jgi:hypothetical protein
MTEPLTAEEFLVELRTLRDAAAISATEWAGPIAEPAKWQAAVQRRTVRHDGKRPGWAIQQRNGDDIVAYLGTGPHAEARAAFLAYLLDNLDAIERRLASSGEPTDD